MESAREMAAPKTKAEESQPGKTRNALFVTQICLRILSISATLAATLVMITSKQSTVVFGIPMDARYTYCSAFEFCAFANAVACAFCVLSLSYFIIIHRCRQGKNPCRYNFLFLHDLLMMLLVLASSAAATSIGLLGKQGNSHTGWMPICDHFGSFCNQVTTSIALSFFSFFLLMALTLISSANIRH